MRRHPRDTARATADEIIAAGGAAEGAALDVSRRAEVDALADRVAAEHGGIHVWCNIAGIMLGGPFLDESEEDLDRIMAVNLKGVFFGCQAAGRVMVSQPDGGSIINCSSAAADTPSPNIVSYAICKAGVVQMTKTLAVEVGEEARPGQCRRSRVRHHRHDHRLLPAPRRQLRRDHAGRLVTTMRKGAPLRSVGEPEDIAAGVLYLASDASRFMTGQVIRPNGGVAMV